MLTKNSGVVHSENVKVANTTLVNAKDATAALHGIGGTLRSVDEDHVGAVILQIELDCHQAITRFTGLLRLLNVSTAASRYRILCADRMLTTL